MAVSLVLIVFESLKQENFSHQHLLVRACRAYPISKFPAPAITYPFRPSVALCPCSLNSGGRLDFIFFKNIL
jgi:hypothetical protein